MIYEPKFSVPFYTDNFAGHAKYKQQAMDYLNKPDTYFNKVSKDPRLKFSTPELYKEPEFAPFLEFFRRCLKVAFVDMGFYPNFEITGLWSSRQEPGMRHHRHTHRNSFFVGTYYLDGEDNSGGTVFSNPVWGRYVIYPQRIKNTVCKFGGTSDEVQFKEGKLVIWPSWVEHSTKPNNSGRDRTILAFNVMPVGMTTSDPFERYNYQSVENAPMQISNINNVK